jgi:hypothetical protein
MSAPPSGAEALLADIGRAADDLGLGIVAIELGEIRLLVGVGNHPVTITVRHDDYWPVSGDTLRALFRKREATSRAIYVPAEPKP